MAVAGVEGGMVLKVGTKRPGAVSGFRGRVVVRFQVAVNLGADAGSYNPDRVDISPAAEIQVRSRKAAHCLGTGP